MQDVITLQRKTLSTSGSEGRYRTATNTHETYDNQQHLFYVRFSGTQLPTDNESVFQSVGDNYFNVVVIKAD